MFKGNIVTLYYKVYDICIYNVHGINSPKDSIEG